MPTPQGRSAKEIKSSIVDLISHNGITTNKLVAVEYDDTNVNTGNKGGAIQLPSGQLTSGRCYSTSRRRT